MTPLANLNAAPTSQFVQILGGIYEHSEWVAEKAALLRPFIDRENLRQCLKQIVDDSSETRKLELIRAHPDLAGKLARAGALTEASTLEQAGLGLDRLTAEEYDLFTDRNEAYRERFGFPFIICARKTTKQGVLDAFEQRLTHSRDAEILEALAQIHEIARLRFEDAVGE